MKVKILSIAAVSVLAAVILIGSLSYFNYREINLASDLCYEVGGSPKVESTFLAFHYSFSCQ